ncbi:hypothetical protein [Streptomyces sp. NBC_00624]|uniref:hypothetical protein n=1 Tax=Streptomyces sp. NBC_00624 TaxID=2975791 RepID=UPI0030E1877D
MTATPPPAVGRAVDRGAPGRTEALPGGTCGPCRGEQVPVPASNRGIPVCGLRDRMAEVRAAMVPRT